MNNLEKIKRMSVDEMAEFIFSLDHCSEFDNCTNCFIWVYFRSLCKGFEEKENYKQWLLAESEE